MEKILLDLAGNWSGYTRTWFEPGLLGDESKIRASFRSALDDEFLIYKYRSNLSGKPYEGMMVIGYNAIKEQFENSWIDSFHMGSAMMFSTGTPMENGFSVLGRYPDPDGGPDWSWRTEFNIVEEGRLIISMINISPQGQEALAVESRLRKRKGRLGAID